MRVRSRLAGKLAPGNGSAVIRPWDALPGVSRSEHLILLSSLSLCSVYKWPKMNPAMIQRMQGS
jgi:hypothetical protein